jgi:hypothetical protein
MKTQAGNQMIAIKAQKIQTTHKAQRPPRLFDEKATRSA